MASNCVIWDLNGLKLTHYALRRQSDLTGLIGDGEAPALRGLTAAGTREPRDSAKGFLSELVAKLNEAFGADVSDKDKVAFAVHISEKVRDNTTVMAQVQSNDREQAMKADLPKAIAQAVVAAMGTRQAMSTKYLSDQFTLQTVNQIVYELLKNDNLSGELISAVR